ncbi:hypothetical protein BFP76_14470 [Amylibacter kogurei]|uniref:Uncharacterized protein n=1 Tax=Paramylibacter kogurei TaxID=1889778 RepID=A0A2G5KAU0_9RHOB|nr:hypothetical protein BFP76_14470 [Amylibacter kogurei]
MVPKRLEQDVWWFADDLTLHDPTLATARKTKWWLIPLNFNPCVTRRWRAKLLICGALASRGDIVD